MDDLARGYGTKNGLEMNELDVVGTGLNSDTLLIIKLPDSRVLRILSRSFFLAMVLLTLPSLGSIMRDSSRALYESDTGSDVNGFKILPILFRDLVDEGLIKMGHKGLIVRAGAGEIRDDLDFLKEIGIDLITESDLRRKKITQNEMFDFVFALSFHRIKQIDGILNNNGIVIAPLSNDASNDLHLQAKFRFVYLQRYENTVVAMRKSEASTGTDNSPGKQISCGTTVEAKKDALKGLEDVYLEPPRRALAQSSFRSRKIKFLPDLLKDSLENYPRRIFIADDSSALDWFYKYYPMRDQKFEIFNMELKVSTGYESSSPQETGVSSWLTKNVKNEDYVVMKAEAQVVEEMLKEKTICLVDELFLECKNQWQQGGGGGENGSKRAYWQCLALYGKLRDEGVAVHQW